MTKKGSITGSAAVRALLFSIGGLAVSTNAFSMNHRAMNAPWHRQLAQDDANDAVADEGSAEGGLENTEDNESTALRLNLGKLLNFGAASAAANTTATSSNTTSSGVENSGGSTSYPNQRYGCRDDYSNGRGKYDDKRNYGYNNNQYNDDSYGNKDRYSKNKYEPRYDNKNDYDTYK